MGSGAVCPASPKWSGHPSRLHGEQRATAGRLHCLREDGGGVPGHGHISQGASDGVHQAKPVCRRAPHGGGGGTDRTVQTKLKGDQAPQFPGLQTAGPKDHSVLHPSPNPCRSNITGGTNIWSRSVLLGTRLLFQTKGRWLLSVVRAFV